MTPLQTALVFTRREEGGFVDNPEDHGGATNFGITQATYDRYRGSKGLSLQSVRLIADAEVEDIYAQMYWATAHCQEMPLRLAVCHFDWSVQHGPDGAIQTLQEALGIEEDGVFGPETRASLQHAEGANFTAFVSDYLELRRTWYRADVARDPTQEQFEDDWLGRVDRLAEYIQSLR